MYRVIIRNSWDSSRLTIFKKFWIVYFPMQWVFYNKPYLAEQEGKTIKNFYKITNENYIIK